MTEAFLHGVSENTMQEISSSQLQHLQATNAISEFYHLHMSTSNDSSPFKLRNIPPLILPLLDKYDFLFHDLTSPLTRS